MTEKRYIDDPVEQKRRAILDRVVKEIAGEDGIVRELNQWAENACKLANRLYECATDSDVETDSAYLYLDDLRSEAELLSNNLRYFAENLELLNDQFKAASKETVR